MTGGELFAIVLFALVVVVELAIVWRDTPPTPPDEDDTVPFENAEIRAFREQVAHDAADREQARLFRDELDSRK